MKTYKIEIIASSEKDANIVHAVITNASDYINTGIMEVHNIQVSPMPEPDELDKRLESRRLEIEAKRKAQQEKEALELREAERVAAIAESNDVLRTMQSNRIVVYTRYDSTSIVFEVPTTENTELQLRLLWQSLPSHLTRCWPINLSVQPSLYIHWSW